MRDFVFFFEDTFKQIIHNPSEQLPLEFSQ